MIFSNTASRVEGIGLDTLAAEARHRHQFAYAPDLTKSIGFLIREEFINGDQAERNIFQSDYYLQVAQARIPSLVTIPSSGSMTDANKR